MDLLSALLDAAHKVTATASGSGLERQLTLALPAGMDTGGLGVSLVDRSVVHEAARPVDVDLTFFAKNVRFGDAALSQGTIGGMPVVEGLGALPGPGVMFTESGASGPGVPGLLGALKGQVKLPVERIVEETSRVPVTLQTRWSLREGSQPVAGAAWSTDGQQWHALPSEITPGDVRALKLRLPLAFGHLHTGVPPVRQLSLHAAVTLSTSTPHPSVSSGWIEVQPPVTIPLPTVPVPTVLVLFEHSDFRGRALVVVPTGSIVGKTLSVGQALGHTTSALSALAPGHALLGFLGSPTAAALLNVAPSPGQVLLAESSRINNTSAYVFDAGSFGFGRFTAEDSMSSFIAVGPAGTTIKLHAPQGAPTDVTPITVTLDDRLHIAVSNLNTTDPGANTVSGGAITGVRAHTNFNDKISSIEILLP